MSDLKVRLLVMAEAAKASAGSPAGGIDSAESYFFFFRVAFSAMRILTILRTSVAGRGWSG